MSTYSRARTKRQQRHVAPRCKSHNRDKQQGEARQRTRYVAVDAPKNPSPERDFGQLESHEYILDGKTWRRCEGPEEFADYTEDEAKFRSWYRKQTTRKSEPHEPTIASRMPRANEVKTDESASRLRTFLKTDRSLPTSTEHPSAVPASERLSLVNGRKCCSLFHLQ